MHWGNVSVVQPDCVGDESEGGKEEEGFKLGDSVGRVAAQCAGASGEAEYSWMQSSQG